MFSTSRYLRLIGRDVRERKVVFSVVETIRYKKKIAMYTRVVRTNKSVVNEELDLHFYDVIPMHNFTPKHWAAAWKRCV